jgi:hypothetical protein
MAAFIARAILWFVVGFILFDIILHFPRAFRTSKGIYFVICYSLATFSEQLGLGVPIVVQMPKPLNCDLVQRARSSMLK